jgi:predicted transcriptional regulator
MNDNNPDFSPLVAEIIAAYVTNNKIDADLLPDLINQVHQSFLTLNETTHTAPAEMRRGEESAPHPAVPVAQSITEDYLVCLEDGRKMKMLKRHLRTAYSMTPDQYRSRWGLAPDYPMVAPNYAKKRSRLAKQLGLGIKDWKRK